MYLLLLAACLNTKIYLERLDQLDDDDLDGFSDDDGDCDDANDEVFPDAPELCNLQDDDCDQLLDEDPVDGLWADDDGDGFGDAASIRSCAEEDGYVDNNTDCRDDDATIYPGADEHCDTIDEDCDGTADNDPVDTAYPDADGDSFGDANTLPSCDGVADNNSDCDDTNDAIHPGATESCNGLDDDCSGAADDNAIDLTDLYVDADGDGYGDEGQHSLGCLSDGYATQGDDCDDTNAAVYPGAPERLDGVGNDCTETENKDQLTVDDADLTWIGEEVGDQAGAQILIAGDWDGDGGQELLVGAPGAGRAYAIHSPFSGGLLSDAALILDGWTGMGMTGGSDLDGDGTTDLALTVSGGIALLPTTSVGVQAPTTTLASGSGPLLQMYNTDGAPLLLLAEGGTVYAWDQVISGMDTSDAVMTITGLVGTPVLVDAGDIDLDGADDVLIGDPSGDQVLIFSLTEGTHATTDASATLTAEQSGDQAGAAVAPAGDHDGDSQPDIFIGAPGADIAGTDDGRVYVVYGPVRGSFGLDAAGGVLNGRGAQGRLGTSLPPGFDTNADAKTDLIVGLPYGLASGESDAGGLYVFEGALFNEIDFESSYTANIQGTTTNELAGLAIDISDVNLDGQKEVLIASDQHAAGSVRLFYTGWE